MEIERPMYCQDFESDCQELAPSAKFPLFSLPSEIKSKKNKQEVTLNKVVVQQNFVRKNSKINQGLM